MRLYFSDELKFAMPSNQGKSKVTTEKNFSIPWFIAGPPKGDLRISGISEAAVTGEWSFVQAQAPE